MIFLDPLRDAQRETPADYCRECGAELYQYENTEICEKCKEEIKDE